MFVCDEMLVVHLIADNHLPRSPALSTGVSVTALSFHTASLWGSGGVGAGNGMDVGLQCNGVLALSSGTERY